LSFFSSTPSTLSIAFLNHIKTLPYKTTDGKEKDDDEEEMVATMMTIILMSLALALALALAFHPVVAVDINRNANEEESSSLPSTCSQQEETFSPSWPAAVEMAGGGRHGQFLVMRGDKYVGPSLKTTGEWGEGEVQQVFQAVVSEGSVVVDVGANIGAHTVALARLVGDKGVVHAIEPMSGLYNLVITNAVLNGLSNVRGHHAFAGKTSSMIRRRVINAFALHEDFIPQAWKGLIRWPLNFGSLQWSDSDLDAVDKTHAIDRVPTVAVDDLGLYSCDFIKIDVEGAEVEVLLGARETIRKYQPAIYLEDDRGKESSSKITNLLVSMDYVCHPHQIPLYNHDNYKDGDPWGDDVAWVYGGNVMSSHNQLCVHKAKAKWLHDTAFSWGSIPFGAPRSQNEARKPQTNNYNN